MKYKSTDVQKLIDIFAEITENRDNPVRLAEEISKLTDYPLLVIQKFLHCMELLDNKDEDYLKENYMGIIGYITLRLNFT